MAHLIPATPLRESSNEAVRVFHVLKRLPERLIVSQRLPRLHGPGPDFWLVDDNRVLFLAVSSATQREADRMLQPALFGSTAVVPGLEEEALLGAFCADVGRDIPTAILFPNVTQKQLEAVRPANAWATWVGKELLSPAVFESWLNGRWSEPFEPTELNQLRERLTPEVVVPTEFTVRQPVERNTEAALQRFLLDYNQEQALKMDLDLPLAAHNKVREFHLRLINGVAGSGKSLIVLYRAHLLRRLFPRKRILVLTHNRALIYDLRRRYGRLSGEDERVDMYTFMGWCRQLWPADKAWRDIIRHRDREELATQIWHRRLRDTAVSVRMFLSEIDWTKDRLLFDEEAYVAADRTGRGFGLVASMRRRMYAAMVAYQDALQKRQLMDWGDVPRQLWRFWQQWDVALPRYDFILVDEAQFFAPIWFELIKGSLSPETGHLFLVADPSQGFLQRGQSWLASGLAVRGRVHRLNKSYRTTREILDFATLLYRTRLPEDDDEIVVPDMWQMPHGVVPILVPLTSRQDEITRVLNEIRQLIEQGVPKEHILVIHANYADVGQIVRRLNRMLGVGTAVDPSQVDANKQIRVCSLNAATGLESPIVFVMGVHDLYEKEHSLRLSEEERLELIRDNTRKLYMAVTRAGQRLVLTYVGQLPPSLKQNRTNTL